ncbi:MAG: hypothetical protein EBU90_25565 [Proteobacteria bacterium]|nr:hypothetical protein [Pseudomonadota bacterium]NBP15455.1 hypothetical protein [bacterium]
MFDFILNVFIIKKMKKYLLIMMFLPILCTAQTNEVAVKETIVLDFVKNESGEIVLNLKGHKQPIEIHINGVKISSLYEEDRAVNLTQAGFESAILAIDTKSGAGAPKADTQAPIPPVMSAFNPPLATPF